VGTIRIPLRRLAAEIGAADPSSGPPLAGDDRWTSGITLHSDDVRPGDVFAALPGSAAHGADYAAGAVARGAIAVLTDHAGLDRLLAAGVVSGEHGPPPTGGPAVPAVMVVRRPRDVLGRAAALVYGDPTAHLKVIGITGTSGKTTTAFLVEAGLTAAGRTAGLIGTVTARLAGRPLASALTTPEAPDLQALFAVMREDGADAVAMEVSSHALIQGRVAATRFAVGAFTNLSQDHLDFHGDMETYFEAKQLLFDGRAAAEVVVVDDGYGERLATRRPGAYTVSGWPAGGPAGDRAGALDWSVRQVSARPGGGQRIAVAGPEGLRVDADIPLPGRFNVTNAVTALACLHAAGVDVGAAVAGFADVVVPGRLERVDVGQQFLAVVDYAHKPAAVAAVLDAVRENVPGALIVVVGAGGDRDQGKRMLMGANAAERAELVIVTDDNPRSEDPAAIRAELLAGARAVGHGTVVEVGDRREAIRTAVRSARPGDAVVIAGKGHEQGQEIDGVVHPFSDRDELFAALSSLAGSGR
jgi:UDP-N-acetylmuramoyl-L-alanyl-D-glutamate--2,6-diaminopimelate ligase